MRFTFFTWCIFSAVMLVGGLSYGGDNSSVEHVVVAIQPGKFLGWPANNGVWQWDDEILVGFTQGDFVIRESHNIAGRENSLLARSLDGGQTWKMFDPAGYLDDGNQKFQGKNKTSLKRPIDFTHPGIAIRVFGNGYHGNADPEGGFFYSYDRGQHWQGPFSFTNLTKKPEMRGMTFTARTDYLIQDQSTCLFFVTASSSSNALTRIACIQTKNGGQTFEFVSWVTQSSKAAREVMSQTVQLSEHEFLLTSRKIFAGSGNKHTIEIHRSTDSCRTWQHVGCLKVMKTHSNPPALIKLHDGRLCCAYGDRHVAEIRAKYSHDSGKTWGPEFVIRDDFHTMPDDPDSNSGLQDMGYVRLAQRTDGKLVAIYYWATAEHPQQHIAASIWKP